MSTASGTKPGTLVLRNYPDDDALKNPDKYSKALSFSPDIIPLYGAKADQATLTHPASWRGFTGMPIVGGDVNNVYIRGHGSGGPHVASLRVVPSELILWPQVWSNVSPVGSGPVTITGGDTEGTYASDSPLQFRAPHTTGGTHSLVANVFGHNSANEHKNLSEYEPTPSFDVQRYGVDDFLSFLSKDKNYTFYNVAVADPTLEHVSWFKGTQIPDGLKVSLVDDHGKISIPRTPLSGLKEHKVTLDADYDGILTLNIFSPPENPFFEPYTGLSLKVFKGGVSVSAVPAESQLLGALNVIFEPHATRNLRFASPAATELRESKNCPGKDDCHCLKPAPAPDCGPIPVTKPAATGWWFRTGLSDTNNFPHPGPGGYSPDIQPIGTDLTKPGLWNDLQDPSVDYATTNTIELVGNEDNYVFIRGHSTLADIDIQSRLFVVNGTPILHPSQYAKQGIVAQVFDGTGPVDQQSISVADSNQFYMFNRPFDIKAPPNPGTTGGPLWMNQPHYCLIAEVRQKRKCCAVYPGWANDQEEDFATVADFQNWCYTCPLVCYRNLGWVPCTPKVPCWEWCCCTQLVIPECSPCCAFWTIIIECDNPIIPPGCTWTLQCEDNEIFAPNGMCFDNVPISTQSPAFAGCHFTGARPGYSAKLLLCVKWNDGGKKIPPPRIKCRLAMTETLTSPINHLTVGAPAKSESWPFFVTKKYPYIGNQPNPSPLPTFKSTGTGNAWPYPGVPQFVLGQVSLAAKPE